MFVHKSMDARVFALHGGYSASVFVYACVCTSCRDLVTVVCLSIRPAGLEEAGQCTAVVFLLLSRRPPLPLYNISQHSCPLQLSRVHPREDECAVTMLVENALYKSCTGPYCVCVCVCCLCLSGPLWRAVCQHHSDSPGSSL